MNSWKNTVRFYTFTFLFSCSLQFIPQLALASDFYYPSEVQKTFQKLQDIKKTSFSQSEMILSLLPINQLTQLKKQFTKQLFKMFPPSIQPPCDKEDIPCFTQLQSQYRKARALLFGQLHLKGHSNTTYSIDGVYCSKTFTNKDFLQKNSLGPNKIPSHRIVNTEHLWPQSRFSHKYSKVMQKTDLHILYPSSSKANTQRSNHLFGEVIKSTSKVCGTAKLGLSNSGMEINFEPPHNYKGNVARAMFYFSLRYNMFISKPKKEMFKRWSQLDPVDDFEKNRNEAIYKINKTRNPFIDQPESILYISNSWGE